MTKVYDREHNLLPVFYLHSFTLSRSFSSTLPNMALRIGLTGGIGSGKSTVARIFEVLGIPVYYADQEAKRIMNENEQVIKQVSALFGEGAYVNNSLNRPFIASLVFGNKENLDRLNAIVHPATIRAAELWMQRQQSPYAIKEAALIFETDARKYLDYVIGVSAPQHLRISRVVERDAVKEEDVLRRMSNQMDESEKLSLCDFIVFNDEQQLLVPQVVELHGKLVDLCV
jgi:dephospho-CoA kinase